MADLIGIATWNYGGGDLAERVRRFAAMGYNAVSLIVSDARALCAGEAPEVEDAILGNGMAVAVHGGLRSPDQSVDVDSLARDMERCCEWHARTGALVTVNFDALSLPERNGYAGEQMRSVMERLLRVSDGAGFTVGFEDWPRTPAHLSIAEDLLAYSHYGVLIDLGHLNMRIRKPGEDDSFPANAAAVYLEGFTLPLNEIHVHNNNGERDQHAPPDSGTADMAALAPMVRRKGLRGVSTVEIVPVWSGLSEEEGWQAAERSVAYWRDLFIDGDG